MKIHFQSIWLICEKDIKDLIRNFRFVFAFALPLLFNLLFRFVINPEGLSKIGLVDAAVGELGNQYSEIIGKASAFVVPYETEQQLMNAVQQGDVKIGIYIFNSEQDTNFPMITSVKFMVKKDDAVGASLAILSEQILNALSTPASERYISAEYLVVARNNQDYFTIPVGDAGKALTAFGWAIFSGLNAGIFLIPPLIVEEKWKRTLDAILATKVSYIDFILGKALVGWLVVSVAMLASLLFGGGFVWGETTIPTLWILLLAITYTSLLGTLLGVAFDNFGPVYMVGLPINIFLLIPLLLLLGMDTPGLNIILKFIPTFYLFKAFFSTLYSTDHNELFRATFFILGNVLFIVAAAFALLRKKTWHK